MKKLFLFLLLFGIFNGFAQSDTVDIENPLPFKHALVIGNSNYTSLSKLANPVNDAKDVAAVLEYLGFSVDIVLNGNQIKIEKAIEKLKEKLSEAKNTYGIFYYAGHGVQSKGENFLIPVDANIPNENYLRNKTVSVQALLDDLNDAGNCLNIVILDACRDNPFGWNRSGSRGLALVNHQPADSIIVYSTSAGQTSSDGEERNGLFTSHLLPNLATPGLEVNEIFRRTGADVTEASQRQQIPAIYNQFFGTAFLGEPGEMVVRPLPFLPGSRPARKAINPACLWTAGASLGTAFQKPWLIGTLHGTIAPIKHSFIELGFDAGTISGHVVSNFEFDSYYLLSPFIHIAYFMPFSKISGSFKGGFYTGIGSSYMMPVYKLADGKISDNSFNMFTFNFMAGINFLDFIDISYSVRTTFIRTCYKASVGYVYRFK